MNRADFIDVLRDYLAQNFPVHEIEDMIRDYEEYFDAGIEAGKTEQQIISELGSPKKIARDLAEELKFQKTQDTRTSGKPADKLISEAKLLFLRGEKAAKRGYRKAKDWTVEFLNKQEKSNWSVGQRLLGIVLKLAVIFILVFVTVWMINFALMLAGLGVAIIVGFTSMILALSINTALAWAIFFGTLILFALFLFGFQIWLFLFRKTRQYYKQWRNWWTFRVKGAVSHE